MRLIVKGNRLEALHAAERRRIPAVYCVGLFNQTQTILGVPDRYLQRAIEWFLEWRDWEDHRGYPAGTLLWYNTKPELSTEENGND